MQFRWHRTSSGEHPRSSFHLAVTDVSRRRKSWLLIYMPCLSLYYISAVQGVTTDSMKNNQGRTSWCSYNHVRFFSKLLLVAFSPLLSPKFAVCSPSHDKNFNGLAACCLLGVLLVLIWSIFLAVCFTIFNFKMFLKCRLKGRSQGTISWKFILKPLIYASSKPSY